MHLIARGIGKQVIFEEDADYSYYIHLLKRFGKETKVAVCAYCLMENHVHLLVYDRENHISLFMKKLGVSYSFYFNRKYDRVGHLFQDRFTSVAIESEDQMLTVFRYILNNPRKAGICEAADYQWSSYKCFGNPMSFVDTTILQELLGSFDEYASFIIAKYEDEDQILSKNDQQMARAKTILQDILQIESGTVLQSYDKKDRNEALKKLKEQGLTLRQIERLTGISKSVIQRA